MHNAKILDIVKSKINLDEKYIKNIINLLEDGSTIAFIARYRKDMTGNTSDEMLLKFQEVYEYALKLLKRKEEIVRILTEREKLTGHIQKLLDEAITLQALEDIYEPYKGVKNTRADEAIRNGLDNFANIISTMKFTKEDIEKKAKNFFNKNITTVQDAINGAKDVIALRYSQELKTKEALRKNLQNHATIITKKTESFQENGVYKNLVDLSIKAKYIKSHQLLGILRAVNENELSMKIEVDEEYLINNIKKYRVPSTAHSSKDIVIEAYVNGLKRLLLPSLKRELLTKLKSKASDDAIELFGKNLAELLITPPLINHVILGMDPGYKTGCKLAVIDENGNYLNSAVIYLLNASSIEMSSKVVLNLIKTYNITAIAIGNGTGSKETASFIHTLKQKHDLKINYAVVSEIGASVYSASKIAQEEYPDLDVTIRGAISIAARLRDPMSALVKIDPKSLGIGQYQHDVDQKKLTSKLNMTTSMLVNKIGVDLNSASYKLLSYVSGISENLAKNIVIFRNSLGNFTSKKQLLQVSGIGPKAYEQSVGFLRIKDGESFLDNSGIHPENYDVARYMKEKCDLKSLDWETIEELSSKFKCGIESLKDIIVELEKPGYDIRDELEQIAFCEDIKSINELKVGDRVNGVVRNITDFGAFIDIGLKNDALLHISQYSHERISHLMDVLSVNQQLRNIKIQNIDIERNKISLTMLD